MTIPPDHIVIHTDGACSGNPGPGGWGALLEWRDHRKEICGGESWTTSNRMELTAAIRALGALHRPSPVILFTDSKYLRQGITSWIHRWKTNGWTTAARQPVKNADLWRELDSLIARHKVDWRWVKGHAGIPGNECADQLAHEGLQQHANRSGRRQDPP